MEKRGYLRAGPWTPEATCEYPEAVYNMHREFGHAGCDVHQVFSFYASEDKLANRGNEAAAKHGVKKINEEGCRHARRAADEYGGIVAGGICQTPSFLSGASKEKVQEEFHKQCRAFQQGGVDFLIAEYYEHIEEMEWAIEAAKQYGMPVAAFMCINKHGDLHNTSIGECAKRMAGAGADLVGVNCHFDPFVSLEAMMGMKMALEASGHMGNPDFHLAVQPIAYWTPECSTEKGKQGFIDLPEFPFALEPRVLTRWEMQKYARMAWDMGVRYIGGCCGFEPYHIRAVVEELEPERPRNAHQALGARTGIQGLLERDQAGHGSPRVAVHYAGRRLGSHAGQRGAEAAAAPRRECGTDRGDPQAASRRVSGAPILSLEITTI